MIGNLRTRLGRNSSTRLPPASVAIEVAEGVADNSGGNAGLGIVGYRERSGSRAAGNPGKIELIDAVVTAANQRLASGE